MNHHYLVTYENDRGVQRVHKVWSVNGEDAARFTQSTRADFIALVSVARVILAHEMETL